MNYTRFYQIVYVNNIQIDIYTVNISRFLDSLFTEAVQNQLYVRILKLFHQFYACYFSVKYFQSRM